MKKKIMLGIAVSAISATSAYAADLSETIVGKVPQKSGVCAIIGGDANLANSITDKSNFTVYAKGKDAKSIEAAANSSIDKNTIGKKSYFAYGKLDQVPFPDNYLDLLVVDVASKITEKEALRAISPNGKALFIENGKVKNEISKPFPKEWDNWGHWYHDGGNNTFSKDTLKWPYLSQWMGLPYEGSVPTVIFVSDGRNFTITGPSGMKGVHEKDYYANVVVAKNVFNGEELWRYSLPKGYFTVRSCAVATKDIFYVSVGNKIVCLDTTTGKTVKEIKFDGVAEDLKWIAIEDNKIFAMAGKKDPLAKIITYRYVQANEGGGKPIWGYGSKVAGYDLKTEKTMWVHDNEKAIDSRSIGLSNGRLVGYAPDSKIVCLDTSNGKVLWTKDEAEFIKSIKRAVWSKPYGNNILRSKAVDFLCTPKAIFLSPIFSKFLYALNPDTGEVLWKKGGKKKLSAEFKFLEGDKLYISTGSYDAMTGSEVGDGCGSDGCGPINASPNGFYGRSGINFNRATGKEVRDHSYRSSCYQSSFAANGLLVNPMYWCGCSYMLRGHTALSAAADFNFTKKATTDERLETFSKSSSSLKSDEKDWVSYKGNNNNSGVSKATTPATIAKKWEIETNAKTSTPPISIGDNIYFGDSNGLIRCFVKGKEKWNYKTGGKIFASPTFSKGNLFVGSSDGFVYKLDAENGKLIWRFRGTPKERKIMVYGYLSDTWPVNSGILIKDGIAYFGAGIVDRDGTHIFAINADTGELKWHNNTCGWVDKDSRKGVSVQGYMTIQNNHLFLAGGNAVTPAAFDLETGKHIYSGFQSFSAYTAQRRGVEMTSFGKDFLLAGGFIMYRTIEESNATKIMKASSHCLIKTTKEGKIIYPELELTGSTSAPVCNDKLFIIEKRSKKDTGITAYNSQEVEEFASKIIEENKVTKWKTKGKDICFMGGKSKRKPKSKSKNGFLPENNLWKIKTGNVLAMALTENAFVYLETKKERKAGISHSLSIVSNVDGKKISSQKLSDRALYNAICITRNGNIIVTTIDGKITCFGE